MSAPVPAIPVDAAAEAAESFLGGTAEVGASASLTFEIRSACDDAASVLRCKRGAPAGTLIHSLPAGSYWLLIESQEFREVDYALDLTLVPPTPVPPSDTCEEALPVTPGTPAEGTLTGMEDDLETAPCGFAYQDAVYFFTLAERRDVTVTVDGRTVTIDIVTGILG